ncbi:MAG: phospholipid carrier-dependent glycosyltransferase [Leptothrix sp. (in: b-proteobacteria)]
MLLVSLPWRPLALPDEGRYVGVAAAMWHSGDWIVPKLNGLPFFHKPPLFYWLAALFYGLSGETAWVSRMVSWLAAMLGLLSLVWLVLVARQGAPKAAPSVAEHAKWSALVLATQPLWLIGAQYANLDMLVAGMITAAICALGRWALQPEVRYTRWLALLAISLGVLAKGLIGIVLPVGVVLLWLVWERRWRQLLRMAFWPGWLLLPVLVLPWFLLVEQRHPGFMYYFFVVQHFKRFVGSTFNGAMPAWFYPAVLLVMMLPWSPLLLAQAGGAWRRLVAAVPSTDPVVMAQRSLERLAWCWLVFITLFFSLPNSKLLGYILPVAPAMALLIGACVTGLAQSATAWQRRIGPALVLLGTLLPLGIVAVYPLVRDNGSGALAQRLQPLLQPTDQLAFWGDHYYDLPLLLHRPQPVPVLAQRLQIGSFTGDGWEQELLDAAQFDLPLGRQLLRQPDAWPSVRCSAPRTWLIAHLADRAAVAQVSAALPVAFSVGEIDVYLATARECPAAAQHEGG